MSACLSRVTWSLMVPILLHINQIHVNEKSDQSSYKFTWLLRLMGPPLVVSSAHYLWVHDSVNHLFTQSGSASRLQLSEVPNWTSALTAETDPDIRWHRSFKSSRCIHGQTFILCCTCVRLTDEVIWLRWIQISIYIVFFTEFFLTFSKNMCLQPVKWTFIHSFILWKSVLA